MMMEHAETLDGMNFAIQEVDMELCALGPQMNRKIHREVIMEQINELLDTRNELSAILGELAFNEYEGLME
tara:strand:- start:1197 stop:1409 length:213 start_codon:yes stop_codon:yes gene_type:complete